MKQPTGAYTSLKELQSLRSLAKAKDTVTKRQSQRQLSGQQKSRLISRGMNFEEVRQYQPGDDTRTIDWRVSARTQIIHTKCYSEEKEKPIIVAVDQRLSLFFGSTHCFKSVYACHLAALLSWSALEKGDRCGGLVLGCDHIKEIRPVRSHKTVNRFLQQLVDANQQLSIHSKNKYSLADLLQQLLLTSATGSEVHIVTDAYDLDKDCEAWLFQLARHRQVHFYWLIDQLEVHLPRASLLQQKKLAVSDGKNSQALTFNQSLADNFHQQFLEREKMIRAYCQQYGITLHPLVTHTYPVSALSYPLSLQSQLDQVNHDT